MKFPLCGRIPRRRYAFWRGFGSRELPAPKVTAVAIAVVIGSAALRFAVRVHRVLQDHRCCQHYPDSAKSHQREQSHREDRHG